MTEQKIINSSLWAAYGDALGFISELADQRVLKKRANVASIKKLLPWKRFIGGFNGVNADLPKGIYSDDTQLRLATSRSINLNGYFDIDAFAKIELPVFLSYSLGAGIGTKAAAKNLTKSNVSWFSNFYASKNSNYFESGGNGALMRIQPHVWSNLDNGPEGMFLDVIRNTLSTHGHIRAIVGSCLHAVLLRNSFKHNKIPSIKSCSDLTSQLSKLLPLFTEDVELQAFWIPCWENHTGKPFAEGFSTVIKEVLSDISIIRSFNDSSKPDTEKYKLALDLLGGFDVKQRGSGTKTAILSWYLALLFPNDPEKAMLLAANQLHSDTDTIATAAGAILGAINDIAPPEEVLDQDYISREAQRISDINEGSCETDFMYPDIYTWTPPKNQIDSLIKYDNDQVVIKGLGEASITSSSQIIGKNVNLRWSWVRTSYGQTVFIRTRELLELNIRKSHIGYSVSDNNKLDHAAISDKPSPANNGLIAPQDDLFSNSSIAQPLEDMQYDEITVESSGSIDDDLTYIAERNFEPEAIGSIFLKLALNNSRTEDVIVFSSMLVKELKKIK